MRKIRTLIIFITLLFGSFLTSQLDLFVQEPLSLVQPSYAFPADLFGSRDRLDRLGLMRRVLHHVKDRYLDPDRVDPQAMFKSALEALSQKIIEVRVAFPSANKAMLFVGSDRMELSTNLNTLYAVQTHLSDVLKFIRDKKSSDISDEDLEVASVHGVLSALDPHSVYLPKEVFAETKIGTSGKFGGLGIVISIRDSKLTVIAPLDDTPASRAGIQAGDVIKKIGNESTVNMTLTEAVSRMRGPKGTPITLSVNRKGWTRTKNFTIVRDTIKVVSVESELMTDEIGYIKLKNFQGNSAKDLTRHLHRMTQEAKGQLKGLILDLRNNPGGLLDQAIAVSDKFLKDGTIVTTVGINNQLRDEEDASAPGTEPNYPMVVLVNHGSASASEIVAGALQRRNRAIIIGEKTFGKGTVQSLFELPEEAALKLTIAQYLTPGDVSIQSIGISPDIRIDPAFVQKDRISIFPSETEFGESSLEGHFDNPKKLKETDDSLVSLRTLILEKTDDLDSALLSQKKDKKERLKKLEEDFSVKTAHTLLKNNPPFERTAFLKNSSELLAKIKQTTGGEIAKALSQQGIDWSTQSSTQKKDCAAPKASIAIAPLFKGTVKAGQTMTLTATLKNPSQCTLEQAWARSLSKNFYFNEHEFLFGKVLPGATVSRSVSVELPKSIPNSLAKVSLKFQEKNDRVPETYTFDIATRAISMPKFAFSYETNDQLPNNPKEQQNGILEPNESVQLNLFVSNIGNASSEETIAAIRNPEAKNIFLKKGRVEVPKLKPGQKKKVSFLFDIKKEFANDEFSLDLSIVDASYRVVTGKKLSFPVRQGKDSPASKQTMMGVFEPPKIETKADELAFKETESRFLKIQGSVVDDVSSKDFYILVNGKKVYYSNFKTATAPQKSADFDALVPLEKGMNRIHLVARDNQDLIFQRNFVVYRAGKTPEENITNASSESVIDLAEPDSIYPE